MRKLFLLICFAFIFYGSAEAYFSYNSAYSIYQLASKGNIRKLQDAVNQGTSIDAEDGNGQNPICYAIKNSDYVAYKNLVLMKADEHPSCIDRIPEQEYEEFKKGYEIRGGKISNSFSFKKAGMWTLAGIGVAGAAVGIAAAGGGGGGGSSDKPEPTPTPPTPSEPCASFDLIYCVDNGVCDECIGSNRSYYKLTGCKDGYVLNTKKTGCLVNTDIRTEYPLEECDKNGACASAKSGEDTVYKLINCNDGYKLSDDRLKCIKICPGYTQETCPKKSQYLSETCAEDNSYHICTNRTKVIGCKDFAVDEDKCTECRDGYKLINDECKPKCQGYTQRSCDNRTQYIKEKCSDDETYHKCASRNNSEGCDIPSTDSDTCQLCAEGYKLNSDNICEKLCDGYTRISCDSSQYISEHCKDDSNFHKCKDREKSVTGCMDPSPNSDACLACYDGYTLADGVCNEICPGYTNIPCTNNIEYVKETCEASNLYHKCQIRLNTEGCSNYNPNADECTSCDKGYELSEGKCQQVDCIGYTSVTCDKGTEYQSEVCADNELFHKCRQRTNVTGCSDFKTDADVCTGCLSGYKINNGICEFACPGYTTTPCTNDTQYLSSTCPADDSYHICTWRSNIDGCATFSETSDTCTSCLSGYTLKSGRCEFDCPTMYEDECDNETQYISSVCPTAPTYHICSERKNTENCTDYNPYRDECTSCDDEYKVVDGKCTHICSGYTKDTCDIETYYAVADCSDSSEYHRCVERTNFSGCSHYSPSSDNCTDCKDGYTLQDGKCKNNSNLCNGYYNTACNLQTQYTGDLCEYDSNYHKCPSRTKSIDGCKTLNPDADECSVCEEGYIMGTGDNAGVCIEKCPKSEGYKKEACGDQYYISATCSNDGEYHICTKRTKSIAGCQILDTEADKCNVCESTYMPNPSDPDVCIEKCPAAEGYKKACTNDVEYISATCVNDPTYLKCKTRTNVDGCSKYAPDADKCLSCDTGYHISGDKCVKDGDDIPCPSGYDRSTHNVEEQYRKAYDSETGCAWWVNRTKVDKCQEYYTNEDKCSECSSGYTLSEDGLTCSNNTPTPSSETICRENNCSSYPLTSCPDNAVCECCEDGSSHYKFTKCMEGATLTGENTCSAPGPQSKTNYNANNTVNTISVTDDNINNYSFTRDANKYTVGFPGVKSTIFDEDKDIYNAQNQNGSIEISALTEQTSFNNIFGMTTPQTIDKYVNSASSANPNTSIFNAYSDGGSESSTISGSISLATGIGILAPNNVYNAFTLHNPGTEQSSNKEITKTGAYGSIIVSSDGYGIYSYGTAYNAYGLGSQSDIRVGNVNNNTMTAFGIYASRIINAYDGGYGSVGVAKKPGVINTGYTTALEGNVVYNAFNDSDKANLKISGSDEEYGAYGIISVGNLNGIGMKGNEVHNAYGYQTYGRIFSQASNQYIASGSFTGIQSTNGFVTNGAKGGTGEISVNINDLIAGQNGYFQSVVGIDNQLQKFNDDVNAYNGYDSLSSGLIKISGTGFGWPSSNSLTGAINTHNGSAKGGVGKIEIVNNNTHFNTWSHIIGLYGGNNYKDSTITITANNIGDISSEFRPFIAGMMNEVGTYSYSDYNNTTWELEPTGEIALLETSHSSHSHDMFNKGKIKLTNYNTGEVYGMLALRHHSSHTTANGGGNESISGENLGDTVNDTTGSIKITATNAEKAYGIFVNNLMTDSKFNMIRATNKANILNAGTIDITGGAYIYGIYATNSNITNTGNINISTVYNDEYNRQAIYGIYADNSEVANTGNITIDAEDRTDNMYGIYAVNGSKVYNRGTITINGESSNKNTADGKFIYIDSGSSIINTSSLVSSTSLNTADLGGGSILMMSGSNITAPEVSGNLILGADITQGSNDDIYVTQNLITGSAQDLSLTSQSAMFDAGLNSNENSADGVLTRKSFESLIDNSSIADYLEHNYVVGNASELFNKLKDAQNISQLNHNISDLFGQKMLSRMTFEDMSMLREVNLDMNSNMFKNEGAFAFGGTVSPSSYANNIGSIGQYSLNGFNHGKTSYALGVSISDVNTYDDNQDNSRSDRSFVMSAPMGYKTRGVELITSPKIGYAYGEYNRYGLDGTYNGKVYKRMYALMNEARYPLNWNNMTFTPSTEFNMIGFNIKSSEDNQKPYHLRIKSQRHYSVEAGMGLTAEKEFSLNKLHNFKMNGGVAFYHEFANPYEIDVSMNGMDGSYRLRDEKRHDNRTVLRFGFDYKLDEDIDVSANLLSNIDGEYRTDSACDIKYHF